MCDRGRTSLTSLVLWCVGLRSCTAVGHGTQGHAAEGPGACTETGNVRRGEEPRPFAERVCLTVVGIAKNTVVVSRSVPRSVQLYSYTVQDGSGYMLHERVGRRINKSVLSTSTTTHVHVHVHVHEHVQQDASTN